MRNEFSFVRKHFRKNFVVEKVCTTESRKYSVTVRVNFHLRQKNFSPKIRETEDFVRRKVCTTDCRKFSRRILIKRHESEFLRQGKHGFSCS